jgi:hypothetical protein
MTASRLRSSKYIIPIVMLEKRDNCHARRAAERLSFFRCSIPCFFFEVIEHLGERGGFINTLYPTRALALSAISSRSLTIAPDR